MYLRTLTRSLVRRPKRVLVAVLAVAMGVGMAVALASVSLVLGDRAITFEVLARGRCERLALVELKGSRTRARATALDHIAPTQLAAFTAAQLLHPLCPRARDRAVFAAKRTSEIARDVGVGLKLVRDPLDRIAAEALEPEVADVERIEPDRPECEPELVGGFHTEYSSMKFALFFLGEYCAMIVMACLTATFFLGGPEVPWWPEAPWFVQLPVFLIKTAVFLFLFLRR